MTMSDTDDATDRARLLAETAQEATALEQLRRARSIGALGAMTSAEAALEIPAIRPAADWRARVFELAEALFQSIRMQLSVLRYKAIAIRPDSAQAYYLALDPPAISSRTRAALHCSPNKPLRKGKASHLFCFVIIRQQVD